MLTVSITDSHLYQNYERHRHLKSHSVKTAPPSWLRVEITWVHIGDMDTCDVFSFDQLMGHSLGYLMWNVVYHKGPVLGLFFSRFIRVD